MMADCISALAAAATAIIAFAALCVARRQISQTRKIAREATATNLYNHCLEMCLQYPKLAEPQLVGGFEELVSNKEQAACYGWFVASLLLSCEEILAVTKNDKEWRDSVSATLDGHADYFRFRNKEVKTLKDFYSDELISVVNDIVKDEANPPMARAIRMSGLKNA